MEEVGVVNDCKWERLKEQGRVGKRQKLKIILYKY